jgi:hypothetical protein
VPSAEPWRKEPRSRLETPRAAGFAGIAFAVLFGPALVLLHAAAPTTPSDAAAWLADSTRRSAVHLAFNLVPFSGIAFLWFMGSVRSRMGADEDKFFATLYVGSGFVFVALLFAFAATAGGLISAAGTPDGRLDADVWRFGHQITFTLITTFAMRTAAVFVISTSIIGSRLGFLPRWLVRAGLAAAVVLLIASGTVPLVELALPVWVLVVSIQLLRARSSPRSAISVADAPDSVRGVTRRG